MKKKLIRLLLLTLILCILFSCKKNDFDNSKEVMGEDNRIEVTMYLWDKNMTKELTPWLEVKFPEYDFNFVIGFNSMDYYKDLASRSGEVPDIITFRRFSLNDAEALSDMLIDFSMSDIAATFYPSYIEYNREHDGAIRWLPMCAVVDGFMANIDLFEEYGIDIPYDYDSFIEAINAFESHGIRGFLTDYYYDYTCLEILQGTAISTLNSLDGAIWRKQYESGNSLGAKDLEKEIWPEVFSSCMRFLKDTKAREEDTLHSFQYVSGEFIEGRAAIIRATSHDSFLMNEVYGMNTAMLPYYGESENDNWILTYPMFQVAVSNKVKENPEKEEAVLRILDAMFSKEGQMKAASDISFLSYNKAVEIEPTSEMRYITPEIESNHLYMRLASTEMFSISKTIVQKMIKGECDEVEVYNEFSSLLGNINKTQDDEVILNQDETYALVFGENGNEAASAILNTIRDFAGTDIAIAYGPIVSSPVYEGEYTSEGLKWLLRFHYPLYSGSYTGEEIIEIMKWLINVNIDGANPIRHKDYMPVTSGIQYEIKDNEDGSYTFLEVTVGSTPIDKEKEYSLLLFGNDLYITSPEYCDSYLPQWLEEKRVKELMDGMTSFDYLLSGIEKNGRILPPTKYVTIKKESK